MTQYLNRKRDLRMLAVELAAARRIGRKLQQLLWRRMTHFEADGFEFAIAYALFVRAERTFSSIRTLARLSNVDDSFALVRVMVEKIVNAEYILLTGTETALDYVQFLAFREWRDLQVVTPEIAPKYTPDVLRRLRDAHDQAKTKTLPDGSQKNRYGRGNDWIEMGLSKRAEAVDELLKKKFAARTFKSTRMLYDATYHKSASYLHGMWASLGRSFESEGRDDDASEPEDGMVTMSVGIRLRDKNPRVAVEALKAANLAALSVLLFMGRVFKKKEYLDWVSDFKSTYQEERRRVGSLSSPDEP